jgi:hypothetical protein
MRSGAEYLARGRGGGQRGPMLTHGTTLAGSPRMNDRPPYPATSLISQPGPSPTDAPAPVEADPRHAPGDGDGDGELDKYDISTLACTD